MSRRLGAGHAQHAGWGAGAGRALGRWAQGARAAGLAGAGRWQAGGKRALGVGALDAAARGLGTGRAAWALGSRPGRWARGLGAWRAAWPRLCTWCTQPVFDPV